MLFRNSILPGHLTRHDFARKITRTIARPDGEEVLVTEQAGYWLQCNINTPRAGRVTIYQMMVDAPARAVSFIRGRKQADPLPPAEQFGLDKGSTRLISEKKSSRDAPVQVPLAGPAEHCILANLLDIAHWPEKRLDVGHKWQRDIRTSTFEGTQTFEFVDLGMEENRAVGRLALLVKGAFKGPLELDYSFDKAQALISWSRPDGALSSIEARAEYSRRRGQLVEKYRLQLAVRLVRTVTLDEKAQEDIKAELTEFAAALEAERSNDLRAAGEACRQFRSAHANSLWLPAVEELAGRVEQRLRGKPALSATQLQDALARNLVAYEAARSNQDFDLLDRTRAAVAQLGGDYAARLAKLAKEAPDENARCQAVFALAFSKRPADFAAVQKYAVDESVKVRSMALAGLALRGDPRTRVEMLMAVLDDKKPQVRRRACEAIAACVPREHFSVAAIIEKLNRLMIHDRNDAVRLEAIRAITALGAPADVPLLEKALTHELNTENRDELDRCIGVLKRRR